MRLTAHSPYSDDPIFVVEQDGDRLVTIEARGEIENAIERWRTRGLIEWVGERGEKVQRVTLGSDPQFLPRLAEYARRYYNMRTELS